MACQADSVNPQLLQGFKGLLTPSPRSPSLRLCLWSNTVTAVLTGNKGSGYEPNTLVNSIMQAFKALMCGDNARIIEGTDAV